MPKQTFFNLPEEKRNRIMELAIDEFANRSYSKASLSNIVARAGIAKGSMYQYFADKKDLYTYLIDLSVKEKLTYIEKENYDPEDDFFTLLEKMLLAGTRFNLAHPKLGRILYNVMEPMGEEVLSDIRNNLHQQSVNYLQHLLETGKQNGHLRKEVDTRMIAHLLNSMLGSGLVEYLLENLNVSIQDLLTSDPKATEQFTEEKVSVIVREIVEFLRLGLAAT